MQIEGLHDDIGVFSTHAIPQTILDEMSFLEHYDPISNGVNRSGLVVDDDDILFDTNSSEVNQFHDQQVWSLLEDDCGIAFLLGAKVAHALGYVCCHTPRTGSELLTVEFEGF